MRTTALILACVVCAALAPATAGAATPGGAKDTSGLTGTISMSGAWALYPMAVRWAEKFMEIHPGVRIDIGAGGAGKGMADALAGAVDLGMVSREIYPAEIERGAWWVSVTRDAVVPVVSSRNPEIARLRATGVTRDAAASLWLGGRSATWGELAGTKTAHPVRVYTRSDACGAAQTWAAYLGGTQEDLRGVGVYGDPGLADAVRRDALGIGYNNINYVYDSETGVPVDGLAVLPVDLDGDGQLSPQEDFYATRDELARAIAEGRYPSPPARDLHLVSNGVPESALVKEFLRWVLNEGQSYVSEAGYVKLPEATLAEQLERLKGE